MRRRWMPWIALCALTVAIGCRPADTSARVDAPSPTAPNTQMPTVPQGSGGIGMPAGGAAAGLSPVTGTESLQGSGAGGVGQTLKDRARQLPGASGNPGGAADPTVSTEPATDPN